MHETHVTTFDRGTNTAKKAAPRPTETVTVFTGIVEPGHR